MASRKTEYVSLAGLRQDGRKVNEWRHVAIQCGVLHAADGSCALQCGNTRVMAAVYGPKAAERMADPSAVQHDDTTGAQLTCDVVIAAFSGQRHRVQQGDRRTAALANLVVETLRSAVFLTTYPNSQIDIHVQVLQDDGGVESAVMNAAALALQDAHVPMRDFVLCTNVVVVGEHIVVDPTRREASGGGADMTFVTYAHAPDQILTFHMDKRAKDGDVGRLMDGAVGACQALYGSLEQQLRDYISTKAAMDVANMIFAALLLIFFAGVGHVEAGAEAWSYENAKAWGSFYPMCNGLLQSPINLHPASAPRAKPAFISLLHPTAAPEVVEYRLLDETYSLDRHVVLNVSLMQVSMFSEAFPAFYSLDTVAWYTPALHAIDGLRPALEVVLEAYPKGNSKTSAVFISFLYEDAGQVENEDLKLYLEGKDMVPIMDTETLDLIYSTDFLMYPGSQPHPPCAENVTWAIARYPQKASTLQIQRMSQQAKSLTPLIFPKGSTASATEKATPAAYLSRPLQASEGRSTNALRFTAKPFK